MAAGVIHGDTAGDGMRTVQWALVGPALVVLAVVTTVIASAQRMRYADAWPLGPGYQMLWDANGHNASVSTQWTMISDAPVGSLSNLRSGLVDVVAYNSVVYQRGGASIDNIRPPTRLNHEAGRNVIILPNPGNASQALIFEAAPLYLASNPSQIFSGDTRHDSVFVSLYDLPSKKVVERGRVLGDGRALGTTVAAGHNSIVQQINAIMACDGRSYWVVVLHRTTTGMDSVNVVAWFVGQNGVDPDPVVSTVMDLQHLDVIVAPDGEHLLIGNRIMRFDRRTGAVTPGRGCLARSINWSYFLMGQEFAFSPDARYIYEVRRDPTTVAGAPMETVVRRWDRQAIRADDSIPVERSWSVHQRPRDRWDTTQGWGFMPKPAIAMGPDSNVYVMTASGVARLRNAWGPSTDVVIDSTFLTVPGDDLRPTLVPPNHVTGWYVPQAADPVCRPSVCAFTVDTFCIEEPCATFSYTGEDADSVVWEYAGATPNSWRGTVSPCVIPPTVPGLIRVIAYSRWGSDTVYRTLRISRPPDLDAGPDVVLCPGATGRLAATGAMHYRWSPPDGLSDTTIANPVVVPPAVETRYTVRAWTVEGCEAVDSVTVLVQPFAATVTADTSVCRGTPVVLRAGGGQQYTWSPRAGLSSTSGEAVTARPDTSTTYRVIVRGQDCVDTLTVRVTIREGLTVDAGSDVTACAGATVQLRARSEGAVVDTWQWTPTDGLDDASSATPRMAFDGVERSYIVTATTTDGCSASDTVRVRLGTIEASVTGPRTLCRGGAVRLRAEPGGATYRWWPEQDLDDATSDAPLVRPTETTTYMVEVRSGSCVDTASITIGVTDIPTLAVSPDTVICAGQRIRLTVSGAQTYQWEPAADADDARSASPTMTPAATTTYRVIGTTDAGCSDTAEVVVVVERLEPLTVSGDTTICAGDTVVLSVSGASRMRITPMTSVVALGPSSVTVAPLVATTYRFDDVSVRGACRQSATIVVNVRSAGTLQLPSDVTICAGDTVVVDGTTDMTWTPTQGLVTRGGRVEGLAPEWTHDLHGA